MGCCDGASPKKYTCSQLSAVADMLRAARGVRLSTAEDSMLKDIFWNSLPEDLQMEYNWCKWKYIGCNC
jgi:hypothetical protein